MSVGLFRACYASDTPQVVDITCVTPLRGHPVCACVCRRACGRARDVPLSSDVLRVNSA